MTNEIPKTQSLAEQIKSRSHWHVIIQPTVFLEERFSLPQAWELVENCQVRLRGWPYPYLSHEDRQVGNDWISSGNNSARHMEFWTLFQSGQFEHFFAFEEDALREKAEKRAREDIDFPPGFEPSGFLEVMWALYRITEIFEFASRYAQKAIPSEALAVTIGMHSVKDRVLFVMDPMRAWWGFYRASSPVLERAWQMDHEALIGKTEDLTVDCIGWFFERFGWLNSPRDAFREERRKLIERRA